MRVGRSMHFVVGPDWEKKVEIGKMFREKRFRSGLGRQWTGVVCLFSLGL